MFVFITKENMLWCDVKAFFKKMKKVISRLIMGINWSLNYNKTWRQTHFDCLLWFLWRELQFLWHPPGAQLYTIKVCRCSVMADFHNKTLRGAVLFHWAHDAVNEKNFKIIVFKNMKQNKKHKNNKTNHKMWDRMMLRAVRSLRIFFKKQFSYLSFAVNVWFSVQSSRWRNESLSWFISGNKPRRSESINCLLFSNMNNFYGFFLG